MSDENDHSSDQNEQHTSNRTFSQWLAEPQTMIGLSAVLLSLCGLFISIYETSLIRQEQRASVWPHVEIGPSYHEDTVSVHVSNSGIGPARLRAAAVKYRDDPKESWAELLQDAEIEDRIDGDPEGLEVYRDLINDSVLPPASPLDDIFRISVTEEDTASQAFLRAFRHEIEEGNVDVSICYCSVYEECWVTSLQRQYVRSENEESVPKEKMRGSHRVESCEGKANSAI